MPRAKLRDGSVESFHTRHSADEWRRIVNDLSVRSLTGSASPFADVVFYSETGRAFTFAEIVEILPEVIVRP
jgi:hypothetical protein